MKNSSKLMTSIIIGLILLTGCTLPQEKVEVSYSDAPLAWIDAPLDGTHLPLGPVEIVTHASSPTEVLSVQLQVNQQIVAEKPPDEVSAGLALANFVWQAEEPGEYLVTVAARGTDGVWGPYASAVILVGEISEPLVESSPTPSLTETPTITPEPSSACINRAGFISETVPDGSEFSPNTNFTKTWTLVNSGSCTWSSEYSLVFVDGSRMGGVSPIGLAEEVPPGDQTTLSVDLQTPASSGTYQGNWMLMDGGGAAFGLGNNGQTPFWVQIEVAQTIIINPPPIIDIEPPTVSVDYSPKGGGQPNEDQEITFTAIGSDNVGVALIEIYFTASGSPTPNLVGSCSSVTTCEITAGPFPDATYVLIAKAFDAAGNQGSSWPQNVIVFTVVQ